MSRVFGLVALCLAVSLASLDAQGRFGRGRGGGLPVSAREAAPIDLTGYWVSPIIEDWKFRMVTPDRGVFTGVPLNAEGRKVGESWDPARDEAAGEACRAYGAAGLMRLPGRLRIAWQDADTLTVETDAGSQRRIFHFGDVPAPADASWQGQSRAEWNVPGRSLKVETTNLRPGYVRRNGAPYSGRTTVTEYWILNDLPNGDRWLTVITRVDDPEYLTRPYTTSSDFKQLPDAAGWNPTPCL